MYMTACCFLLKGTNKRNRSTVHAAVIYIQFEFILEKAGELYLLQFFFKFHQIFMNVYSEGSYLDIKIVPRELQNRSFFFLNSKFY